MRRLLLILGLFLTAALTLSAQQIPINAGTIDYLAQWDAELRQLVGPPLPAITQMGISILDDSAILMLILGGLQYAFISGFNVGAFVWQLLIKYLFALTMLQAYDSPLPWFGVSFHQLIPTLAANVTAMIDLSSINLMMVQLGKIQAGLSANVPHYLNLFGSLISLGMSFDSATLYVLSFGTSMVGYAMVGFLSIIGPICIGLMLLPPLEWIFSGWLRAMFTYAFYRVANACMVFLGTRLMVWFFNHTINGDYSIGHWFFLLPFVICFTVIFVILSVLSFMATRDVFHGTASMGNPIISIARFAAIAAA